MRFCLRCILYRSSRGTPYRIPIDESRRAATGAFEAKRFTVTEDGVDSSLGGDLAAVRSGYAMEAQRMLWPQSSNYRQAFLLAGSFAQICKTILKKSVSSRIIAVIDDHLTASKSFFQSAQQFPSHRTCPEYSVFLQSLWKRQISGCIQRLRRRQYQRAPMRRRLIPIYFFGRQKTYMFQSGFLLQGFEYWILTYLVSIITGFMCYISLRKNSRASKKFYAICSILVLPFLAFWAVRRTASLAYFQDRLIVYSIAGVIGLLLLLSILYFRNNLFYTFLLSFMAAFIQLSVSKTFVAFSEIICTEHQALTGVLVGFYMSLFLSVLFLFLTCLPRREKMRQNKKVRIVSLTALAGIGCGVILNFCELLYGTALWIADITVCLLTIASWFLLLSNGTTPDHTTPNADAESKMI